MLHPRPPAALDPFMMVDHFVMDEPTFMPHPHAGFSAVTYLFEDSEGGIANRDSLGHDLHIAPGSLLWTQAGSGVLHEELPAQRGRGTHGLQIFVNSAIAHKDKPAQVFERRAQDILVVPLQGDAAGGRVRVVLGEFGAVQAQIANDTPVALLDITLPPNAALTVPLPAHWQALAVVARGGLVDERADADATPASPHALRFELPSTGANEVRLHAGAQGVHLVLLAAQPLNEPVVSHGPFIGASVEQVQAMLQRYHSGQMGRLDPSPVWAEAA
jgi:redox-sensitive bicupin YhaK (pirin superfamily)